MAEQLSAPRITAQYLEHFVNRHVTIVGKVTQLRQSEATIDAEGSVTLLLNRDCHLTNGNAVQVIGKVNTDLTIKVLNATDLGADVNLGPSHGPSPSSPAQPPPVFHIATVWPNTHRKAHLPSSQQLEKQEAELKQQQEKEEKEARRRQREFVSRFGSISQEEDDEGDDDMRGDEDGQENIYSADEGPVYSDNTSIDTTHELTRQKSVLLQSLMHSSASRHYSQSPPRMQGSPNRFSKQRRNPHVPSYEQTQTDSLPSTLPITHTIPSAQLNSSVLFTSSSSHHFTPGSSSDLPAGLPSPPRSQRSPESSGPDFQSQPGFSTDSSRPLDHRIQSYSYNQRPRLQNKPESPTSPPVVSSPLSQPSFRPAYAPAPSDWQTTGAFTQEELEELVDELDSYDSSQDSLAQQRARKGTEDISDPRLKTPRKAHGQQGGWPGNFMDSRGTNLSRGKQAPGNATDRADSDGNDEPGEVSALYDAVVDGIARMEVTMNLDDAGRWRIQRTEAKRLEP